MNILKPLLLALAATSTIAVTSVAEAKPATKPKVASKFLIVPGVRVGPVILGMTRRQVRNALGKPSYVSYPSRPENASYLAREYYKDWKIGYDSDSINGHVLEIETTSPRFKTATGLSIKSTFKDMKRVYPKMTVVREDPFEIWTLSYNYRPRGIGFRFECPRNFEDSAKDKNTWPKIAQSPVSIGIYKRGANWKGYYSSA